MYQPLNQAPMPRQALMPWRSLGLNPNRSRRQTLPHCLPPFRWRCQMKPLRLNLPPVPSLVRLPRLTLLRSPNPLQSPERCLRQHPSRSPSLAPLNLRWQLLTPILILLPRLLPLPRLWLDQLPTPRLLLRRLPVRKRWLCRRQFRWPRPRQMLAL